MTSCGGVASVSNTLESSQTTLSGFYSANNSRLHALARLQAHEVDFRNGMKINTNALFVFNAGRY